jgi:hypothetical protein
MIIELLNLFWRQDAPLAGRQPTQGERAFAHAQQPDHLVAEQLGHFADLALAPFAQHYPCPHAIIIALKHFDPCRCSHGAIEFDTTTPHP